MRTARIVRACRHAGLYVLLLLCPLPLDSHAFPTTESQLRETFDTLIKVGPHTGRIAGFARPTFMSVHDAGNAYEDGDMMFLVAYPSETSPEIRIYPRAILVWHQVINERINGRGYCVSYSPLSGTFAAYDSRIGNMDLFFDVDSRLAGNNNVLTDRNTGSLWLQLGGIAFDGPFAGRGLKLLPVIGTHMRPNLERVISLAPDLILQMQGRDEAALAAAALADRGIPVAVFRVASFADLFSCIARLGVLSGEPEAARNLAASLSGRLEALKTQSAGLPGKPSVFFEVRYPNLLGAGGRSILTEIIAAGGGVNCLAGRGERLVRLNEEILLLLDPDIYLVQKGAMNPAPGHPGSRPLFQTLKAVRRGDVLFVSEDRFSRPGPAAVDAAEELAAFVREWASRRAPVWRH
jgi:ABC-type Fe3+-hydroxamate transport system substrate-binding protein